MDYSFAKLLCKKLHVSDLEITSLLIEFGFEFCQEVFPMVWNITILVDSPS